MELTEPSPRLFRQTAKSRVASIGAKASDLSTAADVGLYAWPMLGLAGAGLLDWRAHS